MQTANQVKREKFSIFGPHEILLLKIHFGCTHTLVGLSNTVYPIELPMCFLKWKIVEICMTVIYLGWKQISALLQGTKGVQISFICFCSNRIKNLKVEMRNFIAGRHISSLS